MGPKQPFRFIKFGIPLRKLREYDKRLRALKSRFYGGAKTACRTDAKSNVTALKQAYNSRSQVPGAPQYRSVL
jgi:hypothetical protein